MPAARDWEVTIRAVVSHALSQRGCRRGWTVLNHRGHVRLNIAAGAGSGRRRQVLLPIPWQFDQVDQIRSAVVEVFEGFQQGIEPEACVARMAPAEESTETATLRSTPSVASLPCEIAPGTALGVLDLGACPALGRIWWLPTASTSC